MSLYYRYTESLTFSQYPKLLYPCMCVHGCTQVYAKGGSWERASYTGQACLCLPNARMKGGNHCAQLHSHLHGNQSPRLSSYAHIARTLLTDQCANPLKFFTMYFQFPRLKTELIVFGKLNSNLSYPRRPSIKEKFLSLKSQNSTAQYLLHMGITFGYHVEYLHNTWIPNLLNSIASLNSIVNIPWMFIKEDMQNRWLHRNIITHHELCHGPSLVL